MKVHEPGHCSDSLYGDDCSGAAQWSIDPYAQEIHGETEYGWFCEGILTGKAMDI